jgi:hypothetical protein
MLLSPTSRCDRLIHCFGLIAVVPVTPLLVATATSIVPKTFKYRYRVVQAVMNADPCLCDNWRLRQKEAPAAFGSRDPPRLEGGARCTPRRTATSPQAPKHTSTPLQPPARTLPPSHTPTTPIPLPSQWPTSTGGRSTSTPSIPTAPPTST